MGQPVAWFERPDALRVLLTVEVRLTREFRERQLRRTHAPWASIDSEADVAIDVDPNVDPAAGAVAELVRNSAPRRDRAATRSARVSPSATAELPRRGAGPSICHAFQRPVAG